MEYLDRPFQVSVGSGRRPTPTVYEHLRKYSALDLLYQRLASQTDITNINQILENTANLYISNEISRVIAQVIGELDPGFITIKGTKEGGIHVYLAGSEATVEVEATLQAGTETIGNVGIIGTSQIEKSAVITIASAATHDIIAAVADVKHHICSIFFTVAGDVNITLKDEDGNLTGAMDFGGTDEPRGMTHDFGLMPLVCGTNKKFQILLSAAVQVSGVVTYYDEA